MLKNSKGNCQQRYSCEYTTTQLILHTQLTLFTNNCYKTDQDLSSTKHAAIKPRASKIIKLCKAKKYNKLTH